MKPTDQEFRNKAKALAKRQNTPSGQDCIDLANWAMDKALEGMVPAGELIKLDWPDGADGADILFYRGMTPVGPSQPVYRPKPAWAPKVGDHVFWHDTGTIYTVLSVDGDMAHLISAADIPVSQLKPATMDQMGLDWAAVKMP
jgi:hypothetical protein